jgi:hypothetical protein
LIEDGNWECNPEETGMKSNEGIELFSPFLFLEPGKYL